MGKRGTKPRGKVLIRWSENFAYAIGLIVSDGSLSKDGRHIVFTSQDIEQIENFCKALQINMSVGVTFSGYNKAPAYRVQIGDVLFYEFLISIGLMPNKSKIIAEVLIPDEYFISFVRGCFDGDGTVYSYWDKRWKSSFMFYTAFASGSRKFIDWLQQGIYKFIGISGHVTSEKNESFYQLKYAKTDSKKLIKAMYDNHSFSLSRKRLKITGILGIMGESL